MSDLIKQRHPSLPKGLTNEELANWLQSSAVEINTEKRKSYFSPDEIHDFEHESSINGREINRLLDRIAYATAHVKKGSSEKLILEFPATIGTKKLDLQRRQNDDFIETGFAEEEMQCFGIPNVESHMMEYFDIEGNIINERTRPLSAKEKHTHLALFKNIRRDNAGIEFDDESGEVFSKTGSDPV